MKRIRCHRPTAWRAATLAFGLLVPGIALAFTVNISPGTRALYLRVGDGVYSGTPYSSGGTVGSGGAIGLVSVSVPAASLGNGTAQAMTGNSSGISHWDNYQFCNAGEVYIGGFYRKASGSETAILTVSTPTDLVNAGGDTIPINRISWTTRGNGDNGAQPIPAGTFSGGVQSLANFPSNTWRESCMVFSYANSAVVPSGDYNARATYTLSTP
jgi:hypothetical protein